jgi:hypothetical protein
MRTRRRSSLAVLLVLVGAAGMATGAGAVIDRGAVTGAPPETTSSPKPSTVPTTPAKPAPSATVVVHRCTDAKGHVTFTDDACPTGSRDQAREMARPKDPPPRANRAPPHPSTLAPSLIDFSPPPQPQREFVPPPAMYQCISYDGIERWSESYDPNPRCEPLVIYYPYPNNLTPAQALSCRWVEDSCVRLSDASACDRWRRKRKDAVSEAQRAFSDKADYWKSEVARLSQIVDESCP